MARSGSWYVLNETLTRGYFCDAIIERRGGKRVPEAFLAGLLSGIDMLLGVPLEEAIARLPLPDDLQRAIVHGDGPIGAAVTLAGAYAGARWEEATARAGDLGIRGHALPVLYQVAASRARELMWQFEPGDGASPPPQGHYAA
jgi:EAL and modified HD-GYP domain-containing signal transduction protein